MITGTNFTIDKFYSLSTGLSVATVDNHIYIIDIYNRTAEQVMSFSPDSEINPIYSIGEYLVLTVKSSDNLFDVISYHIPSDSVRALELDKYRAIIAPHGNMLAIFTSDYSVNRVFKKQVRYYDSNLNALNSSLYADLWFYTDINNGMGRTMIVQGVAESYDGGLILPSLYQVSLIDASTHKVANFSQESDVFLSGSWANGQQVVVNWNNGVARHYKATSKGIFPFTTTKSQAMPLPF